MDRKPDRMRILSDFLDGNRENESFRRVAAWLAEDDAHVRAFVEQLQVEEDLRQLSLIDDVSRYTVGRESAGERKMSTSATAHGELGARLYRKRSLVIMAMAGSLLVGAAVSFGLFSKSAKEFVEKPPAENHLPSEPVVVATLGATEDCRWESGSKQLPTGHIFSAGSAINLASGMAQLTFEAGAVLLLQGPCQLELAENAIELNRGRISAIVPRAASGFTVTTPSSEIIDLGTKFGVNVDELGNSQIHVFSGEVVTRARNRRGETVGEPMFVTTHNAIHFRPGTMESKRFEADEAAFVRLMQDQAPPLSDASSPVEGRLLLWLNNGHWILDDEQRVNAWRDSLSSYNQIADNALQAKYDARPRVVENAIGGWPAVRFDGIDDCLITTPMASGDSQTVVFVASIFDSTCDNPQIINYNGPPQYRRLQAPRPAILQMIAKLDDSGRIGLVPFAWLGDENVDTTKGICVGEANQQENFLGVVNLPGAGEPFIAIYSYDHEASRAELWVNNRSLGSSTAPIPLALVSRKVIGRHGGHPYYFCGDIAELMIFDEGFDRDKAGSLFKQLAKKYSIPLSP
ncbi:MAG: FecR family protein [Pirellulales bacterium]|nr:FecR family protein [Pirellulales bacterium]